LDRDTKRYFPYASHFSIQNFFKTPASRPILLSFFYSAMDEFMHWSRYMKEGLDRVEMWSHFVAITGHALMIGAWWRWLDEGYPGLAETSLVFHFKKTVPHD